MPELRQDPASKRWVIIARERSKRPHAFVRLDENGPVAPAYSSECPFCGGNEELTPPETFAVRDGTAADTPGWRVRAVPNKFAALLPVGSTERRTENEFFRWMDGVGKHEVIVESPVHNLHMALMDDSQVQSVVAAYRERYLALREDTRFKLILIFKNHGVSAGTSLEHPHSQLVATPVVPNDIRTMFQRAFDFYDDTGSCVYCQMLAEELRLGKRLILETDGFVVFHPFASRMPFETWIVPRKHGASFGLLTVAEASELAVVLKQALRRIHFGLKNPDFNMIIQTAPVKDEFEEYFHWHIQILPRLTTAAGFEMGTGIYINVALPEETAQFMRAVDVHEAEPPRGSPAVLR
ncbi:MAG: galactose-1-phosphate uridylyltransferase [Pseudomonadota bacterium]